MKIEPIAGSFAREVTGVDLWRPLSDAEVQLLREAYAECPVLVFRRQALNSEDLLRFAGYLGTAQRYVERSWWSERPEISFVSNMRNDAGEAIGGLSSRELNWHMDQSYNAVPVTGCMLYAQVLPESGSRTCWSSLYGGWESLDASFKTSLVGAAGVFSYAARTGYVIPGGADEGAVQQSYSERILETPDVRHPLVHTHPLSGRQALYFDPGTTIAIDGVEGNASDRLFDAMLDASTDEKNVYEHDWEVGDLVLWDNAATLHRRDAFGDNECRLLKRIILDLPPERHIIPPLVA